MRILTVLLVLILGLAAYVRFSPTNVAVWHRLPDVAGPGDTPSDSSFLAVRRITAPADQVLMAVEQRALATPRTTLLAGSIAEGMLTFQTRSLLWGFPDYTTVGIKGDLLVFHGRLRFGQSDMGVNRARIEEWLSTLGPLTEPL